ncbi:putative PEP-CTERM system TPR-repeat lipoprotein [Halospina denitrificans]|uniref:Putative PEP-CTERM system TPR-repeat lipoprotein n=1 Tax=Halospina denitrificans TaxID=332522 RepID=A0A4R7JTQ4_9GAMM|nr:tetratricopeptide repeat protein [Halospina denitrificans]TDT41415.1 putative PEP-CTERM system TPR-repeat lipoprotein [Halospina denitrificans]
MQGPKTRGTRLSLLIGLVVVLATGCSGGEDMTQKEVEYLSHMDQAQFFQQQGELKASTQEARSAIEAQPDQIEPYFILINNLLTAGDGRTAESQLQELRGRIDETDAEQRDNLNRLAILVARAKMKQDDPQGALEALEDVESADRSQQLQASILRADAHRQAGKSDEARRIYQEVLERDPEAVMALLGLSRLAYEQGQREQARNQMAKAEEVNADDPEVLLWKARMAHREERYDDATEAYTAALEDIGRYDVMTRRKYETISALIDVLREKGDASQAFVYEEILADSAPGTLHSGMESAREAYQRGNFDTAAGHLTEVLAQAPGHEAASIMLGMIRFQQGRVGEAEELLAGHVDKVKSGDLTKMLAAARIQLERPEQAREMLEELDPQGNDPGVVALIGIAALSSGDTELGRGLIEQSLAMAPDNAALRVRYARYLMTQDETDEAISQLEEAIERTPTADKAHALLARVLAESGREDNAEQVVSQWMESQPDNVHAYNIAGDIAQMRGDSEAARGYYREAIGINADTPESHFALGMLEARGGNADESLKHLRHAVERAPDNGHYIRGLLSLAASEGRVDETMEFLETVGEAKESSIGPYLTLLRSALDNGKDERASQLADTLSDRMEGADGSRETIGDIYGAVAQNALSNGNTERAQKVVRNGRERFRSHERLALIDARLQFLQERPSDAREILRTVKTEHPDSAAPYIEEANYFMRSGSYREASELYQLARDKQDSVPILLRHARALRQQDRTRRAIEVLEEGSKRFGDNHQIPLNLAMLYQGANQKDKARQAYETTLELAPDNTVALNNLAWLIHEEDTARGLELAERAYNANAENPAVADTYGWILLRNGEVSKSIEVLEKARERAPDSRDITQHLAEAYREAGQPERADALMEQL